MVEINGSRTSCNKRGNMSMSIRECTIELCSIESQIPILIFRFNMKEYASEVSRMREVAINERM